MRYVSIISYSILASAFLATLLPPHLHTRAAIIYISPAVTIITSLCQIVTHNTGFPSEHWCLPVGIPAGAIAGTVEYLAARARRRGTWDVTGDLSNLWEGIQCEMSTQGPRIWCEMTGGRFVEEEAEGSEEKQAVGSDELWASASARIADMASDST